MMLENRPIKEIHITRYIASWVRSGGTFGRHGQGYNKFKDWLRSLGLTEDEVSEIAYLAQNGKMELEDSAKKFMSEQ